MDNNNVKFYMNGCRLIIDIEGGTPDIYLVLLNTNNKEHSDILKWTGTFEFDMEKDGIYKVFILKNANAVLNDSKLTIDNEVYDVERFVDTLESNIVSIGESFTEEIFCICNLKKCLLSLQTKAFNKLLKNCGSIKCKDDEIKSQRDFIFLAVWLMEHLIEQNQPERAKEIYESIQSCGSICNNMLKSNNCGCNG